MRSDIEKLAYFLKHDTNLVDSINFYLAESNHHTFEGTEYALGTEEALNEFLKELRQPLISDFSNPGVNAIKNLAEKNDWSFILSFLQSLKDESQ